MKEEKLILESVVIKREEISNPEIWKCLLEIILATGTIEAIEKATVQGEILISPCELKPIECVPTSSIMPTKEEAHLNRIGYNAMFEAESKK